MTRQSNWQVYISLPVALMMMLIGHTFIEDAARAEPLSDTFVKFTIGLSFVAGALMVLHSIYDYLERSSDLPVSDQLQQWRQQHLTGWYFTGAVCSAIMLILHVRAVFVGGLAAFEGKPVLNLIVALNAAAMLVFCTREWRKIQADKAQARNDPQFLKEKPWKNPGKQKR
jgi:hypothetical protein